MALGGEAGDAKLEQAGGGDRRRRRHRGRGGSVDEIGDGRAHVARRLPLEVGGIASRGVGVAGRFETGEDGGIRFGAGAERRGFALLAQDRGIGHLVVVDVPAWEHDPGGGEVGGHPEAQQAGLALPGRHRQVHGVEERVAGVHAVPAPPTRDGRLRVDHHRVVVPDVGQVTDIDPAFAAVQRQLEKAAVPVVLRVVPVPERHHRGGRRHEGRRFERDVLARGRGGGEPGVAGDGAERVVAVRVVGPIVLVDG